MIQTLPGFEDGGVVKGGPNAHLHEANAQKYDEFYTLREDVEWVVDRHRDDFRDKRVFANCDGDESAFTRCMRERGGELGVRSFRNHAGPFGGYESLSILRDSDLVITNPPFSLLRKFILTLYSAKVDFLIVAPQSCLYLNVVMPQIVSGRLHASGGVGKVRRFIVPDNYRKPCKVDDEGNRYTEVPCIWLTTLPVCADQPILETDWRYDSSVNLRYDNYDAIDCGALRKIPCDYDGVMGVPITYLALHNPYLFEIVGLLPGHVVLGGRQPFGRVLIQQRGSAPQRFDDRLL